MSSARWSPAFRYGLPGVLAGLALAWSLGSLSAPAVRAQPGSSAQAPGMLAFTSAAPGFNGPGSAQWLYLVDTQARAFAVYRVDPQNPKGSVKLEAARYYRWDLQLDEFNNQEPAVAAIKSMVGGERR